MQKNLICRNSIISYRIEGKGDPLILIHGFGEDSQIWDEQVLFLKEHCLLIIPDLPGSGKSSLLSLGLGVMSRNYEKQSHLTPDYISIDDYADCIHAILQEELIPVCTILGHSMGGYITLAFAQKYPSLLHGFGLIHSTAFADSDEKKKVRKRAIELITQYGAQSFLKTTLPNLFGETFKKEHYKKVDSFINASASFTKETLQQYYHAMIMRPDRTDVLKSNPLPVLFVIGTEDGVVPMEEMVSQTSLPEKSYIHLLPGVGHMGMLEAPEQLNRIILAFIQRQ